MIFKVFGCSALLAGALAAGTLVAPVAQAANVGSTGFDGNLVLDEANSASPVFRSFGNFADIETSGIFIDYVPTQITDLTLTQVGMTNQFQAGFVDNWKVYTLFGDDDSILDQIFFDLDPGALWTRAVGALGGISYQNGPGYTGLYTRLSDGMQFRGAGFLNLSREADGTTQFAEFEITQDAAAIPSPALLPGLIGIGVAAMRRRKDEETPPAQSKA